MLRLKVCGLKHNTLEVIEQIEPDFAGFIYYEKSPRYVEQITIDISHTKTRKVGVFVDQHFEFIANKVKVDQLDVVQLHGFETPTFCASIKKIAKVIKVFSGNNLPDQETLDVYGPVIDYYLFDTRSKVMGGSGQTFDWHQLKDLKLNKPIIISGGIGLENIDELLKMQDLPIYGIDVNSHFETKPGHKNIEDLKRLKNKIRHELSSK